MKVLEQVSWVARAEGRFFLRFPKLIAAAVLVAFLPSLYALIYLSSVWDPASRTGALPVGLVNLDAGLQYRDQSVNVGVEVAEQLRKKHVFGFEDIRDESVARRRVLDGSLAFALIIPDDFSHNAVPGHEQGAGKLVIYTSEGNNYESAALARSFARELGHDVNESLNERRWNLVLLSAAGSQRSLDQLHQGVEQLRQGAHELTRGTVALHDADGKVASGSRELASRVGQLTGGVKQLGAGLRTMDAKRPRGSDLDQLRNGAEALASGHVELTRGMAELQGASRRLREGVGAYREQARDSFFVPSKVTDGLEPLYEGLVQLDTGLDTASDGQQKLADGSRTLSAGVATLTTGVRALNQGLRSIITKLPEDSSLDDLASGAGTLAGGSAALSDGSLKVRNGAEKLEGGLELLERSLPRAMEAPEGSAQGLAQSVVPVLEVEAPVPNSGNAFAANVIPAALWLGAGIAAFLINVRVLPVQARPFNRLAQAGGKMALPLAIVLAQTLLLALTLNYVLGVKVVHSAGFAVCLLVSATTFLAMVFALTRAFGDAGKALAMVFLAIQISSSGGVLPVELSGNIFTSVSPWLPLTWVVRAMKASMFDAYSGHWQVPLLLVGQAGVAAVLCTCWIGRWRFVASHSVRPPVDF
jgi:putative membrane protein